MDSRGFFNYTKLWPQITRGGGLQRESQRGVPGKALKQESEVLVPGQGSATKQLCDTRVAMKACKFERGFFFLMSNLETQGFPSTGVPLG